MSAEGMMCISRSMHLRRAFMCSSALSSLLSPCEEEDEEEDWV